MKRILSLCLAAVMLVSVLCLSGCRQLSELTNAANDIKSAVDDVSRTLESLSSAKDELSSLLNRDDSSDSASSESSGDNQSRDGDESPASGTYTMADIAKLSGTKNFSDGALEHIFDGTINRKGKATGYHYTLVSDSKGELIAGTRSKTDENGVFTGKVQVSGVKKNGFSSFYPETWSPQEVVNAINAAYDDACSNPDNPRGSLWIGHYGDLEIDMYLDNNKKITTAFPIYEGD